MDDETRPAKHKFKPGQKFWMIYKTTGKDRRPPYWRHPSLEEAQIEADRLAAKHPGILFAILETVGGAFVPKPADQKDGSAVASVAQEA